MAPPTLLMDLYELTMLAGYFEQGMHERPATFDFFFREAPFHGAYAVLAGLDPALDWLTSLRFDESDLDYLESLRLMNPRPYRVALSPKLHELRLRLIEEARAG